MELKTDSRNTQLVKVVQLFKNRHWIEHVVMGFALRDDGAPIAQLGERRTLDRKVAGSILTLGTMLCP